jgi:hypothetical protein
MFSKEKSVEDEFTLGPTAKATVVYPKLSGRKKFHKLPNFFLGLEFFQSAQNVWSEIQNFFNLCKGPKTICSIKIPQMPENFKHQDISRVPKIFGQN